MIYRLMAIMGLAFALSACATVTRGTDQDWNAASEPPGASVETSNGYSCAATPCSIRMPRRSEFVATFSKDGYRDAEVTVTNQIAGAGAAGMAGNVLIGGVIGVGVDVASGAALNLHPNDVNVVLQPLNEGEMAQDVEPTIYMHPVEDDSLEDMDEMEADEDDYDMS